MSAPAIVGVKAPIDLAEDGVGIASGTAASSGVAASASQVAVLLGNTSMRVLEAALALGALATALILGIGR